jgi:hypothetical protein
MAAGSLAEAFSDQRGKAAGRCRQLFTQFEIAIE